MKSEDIMLMSLRVLYILVGAAWDQALARFGFIMAQNSHFGMVRCVGVNQIRTGWSASEMHFPKLGQFFFGQDPQRSANVYEVGRKAAALKQWGGMIGSWLGRVVRSHLA